MSSPVRPNCQNTACKVEDSRAQLQWSCVSGCACVRARVCDLHGQLDSIRWWWWNTARRRPHSSPSWALARIWASDGRCLPSQWHVLLAVHCSGIALEWTGRLAWVFMCACACACACVCMDGAMPVWHDLVLEVLARPATRVQVKGGCQLVGCWWAAGELPVSYISSSGWPVSVVLSWSSGGRARRRRSSESAHAPERSSCRIIASQPLPPPGHSAATATTQPSSQPFSRWPSQSMAPRSAAKHKRTTRIQCLQAHAKDFGDSTRSFDRRLSWWPHTRLPLPTAAICHPPMLTGALPLSMSARGLLLPRSPNVTPIGPDWAGSDRAQISRQLDRAGLDRIGPNSMRIEFRAVTVSIRVGSIRSTPLAVRPSPSSWLAQELMWISASWRRWTVMLRPGQGISRRTHGHHRPRRPSPSLGSRQRRYPQHGRRMGAASAAT